jgi:hypothetical protein
VNLDLKAVLERELRAHTALTKGDWVAIRHDRLKELQRVCAAGARRNDVTEKRLRGNSEIRAKSEGNSVSPCAITWGNMGTISLLASCSKLQNFNPRWRDEG